MFAIVSWTSNGCCLIKCKFRPYAAILNRSYGIHSHKNLLLGRGSMHLYRLNSAFVDCFKNFAKFVIFGARQWWTLITGEKFLVSSFSLSTTSYKLLFIFHIDNAEPKKTRKYATQMIRLFELDGYETMPKLTNFMKYVSTKTHFSYYVGRITCIWRKTTVSPYQCWTLSSPHTSLTFPFFSVLSYALVHFTRNVSSIVIHVPRPHLHTHPLIHTPDEGTIYAGSMV